MKTLVAFFAFATMASQCLSQITFERVVTTFAQKGGIPPALVITLPAPIQTGHLLVVSYSLIDGGVGNVRDSNGAYLYGQGGGGPGGNNSTYIMWETVASALSAGSQLTFDTANSPSAISIAVLEFSGTSQHGGYPGPFDQFATWNVGLGPRSGTFADSSTTGTTVVPDELLIGAVAVNGPISDAFTKDPLFTLATRIGTSGGSATGNVTLNVQWRIVSSVGQYRVTGTLGKSRNWSAAISTFR